jgi:hypothetical protein
MRQRPSHLLKALARYVCRAALRAAVTCLIFTACLTAALTYLGVPLPGLDDLLERFESVSRLAEILS